MLAGLALDARAADGSRVYHPVELRGRYAPIAGFSRALTTAWVAGPASAGAVCPPGGFALPLGSRPPRGRAARGGGREAAQLSVSGLWLFARTLPTGALGWRRPRRRARQPAEVRARSLLSKSPTA